MANLEFSMKVGPAQAEGFLKAPGETLRAVLLYGPDEGLVRERALGLVRLVAEDPADPFRVAELTLSQLKEDAARLGDEAAALSMTGGRRVVRLRDGGDGLSEALRGLLESSAGEALVVAEALVVVEAGDLPARSSLRRLFEGSKMAAAVACYRDEGRGLQSLINQMLAQDDLTVAPDALAYLSAHLGGDRQVTRRELEKLCLYMAGPEGGARVELDDVLASIGDSAELTLDDVAYAVAEGDFAELDRALQRSFREGSNPVAALRAVARHFLRLHQVARQVVQGTSLEDAVKRLRPPIFWKLSARFKRQAGTWSARRLDRRAGGGPGLQRPAGDRPPGACAPGLSSKRREAATPCIPSGPRRGPRE
jgi:DNA polymerase-3 subunit delta